MIEDLIRPASRRYEALVVAGFSFTAEAQALADDNPHPKLRLHIVHVRPDVNPGMDRTGIEQEGHRAERDSRLGGVRDPSHELRSRPGIGHRGAVEATASLVEPDHALALNRGVIELFSPFHAEVVEQRAHRPRARCVRSTVEVPREPNVEPPGPHQTVEKAPGRRCHARPFERHAGS